MKQIQIDPNSTAGKIFKGTPLVKDVALDANTEALRAATDAYMRAAMGGGRISGGGSGGIGTLANSAGDIIPASDWAAFTGGGTAAIGGDVVPAADMAQFANAPMSSSMSSTIAALQSMDRLSANLGGSSTTTGGAAPADSGFGLNGKTVAAIGGAVAGGIGAISQFSKGGFRSAIAGTGDLLGSAAAIASIAFPPAALGLGIAAAVTSLAPALFPDQRLQRANQIATTLSANTYQAPTALNVTQDTSGNYTDFDSRGNLRTSNFRADPVVSEPYTYWKTHGTFSETPATPYEVPGNVLSPFQPWPGGNPTPGPNSPPPVIQHIYQAGAISTIDRSGFEEHLRDNSAAVHDITASGLQMGFGRLHDAVQSVAGTRN